VLQDQPDRKHGKPEACGVILFVHFSGSNFMTHIVLSQVVASISELKKNPMGTVAADSGLSVAILNRNEPAFYCVPAKEYEAMMNRLDDLELLALCKERENDPTIKVSIDDL
jgi:antitoxin StbD